MNVDVTIESIGETKTFGANGFRKRELVAMTQEGEYAQPLVFEFVQDKVDLLDSLAEGQEVTIDFNLRGNRWQPEGKPERIFMSLQGWKVEAKPLSSVDQHEAKSKNEPQSNIGSDDEDLDLPF